VESELWKTGVRDDFLEGAFGDVPVVHTFSSR
jgi:hypothetical protein